MGSVSIPIIAAFSDSLAGLGAAGAAGAADAGAAGLGAAGAAGAGAVDAAAVGAPLALTGAVAPTALGATEPLAAASALSATDLAAGGLDVATAAGGLDAATLSSLGGASSALGSGVPGSTATAAPIASPGAAAMPGAATGAGTGASTGSAAAAAAPANVAASPAAVGSFGSVDPSLLSGASAPAGLTGDTAASALGTSTTPTGLAAAPGAAAPATTAAPGAEVAGALGPGAKAEADAGVLGMLKSYGPLALGAGGLLSSVLQGDKKPAYQGQVSAEAAQMSAQGQELQSYLTSGTLPPGVSAGLASANSSAAATIRSQYASRGQTGSSAEAQDLANLNATTVSQGAQIATNLLQQGVSESEFSAQLYQSLMDASVKQDAALSASIANFAGGMAGMGLKATPTG